MNDESTPTTRYLIQDSIGTGGTGQVFRAWDQHLQRPVAIKRLRTDVDMDANIRREAGILAGLHHPNIVTVYDFAVDEIGQFAVMEYVEGSTLEQTVSHQPLSLAAFVELANQVCRGLSAAHSRGLVHLDLKSGNLMLQPHEDRSFTCKILDFGIAHLQHEAKLDEADGTILGSPYTVAPEQLLREAVDARTDLYALGCVFYYALSGREPFAGGEVGDILQRHLYGKPTLLHLVVPSVPEPLSRAIDRMTARQPADRPQSAEEVRQLIQSAARAPSAANRTRSFTPVMIPAPTAAPRPVAKGNGGMAIASIALMAVIAGGFLYFRITNPPVPTPEPVPAPSVAPVYPVVDPLDAQAITKYKGQTVTMEGAITSCEESVLFGARFLRFSDDDAAAIVSIDDNLLSMERAQALVGKRVHATGQLSNAANRTRLVITSEADLVAAQ